jgi:hypothetical protein
LGYEFNKVMTLKKDKIITSPLDPSELTIGNTSVESMILSIITCFVTN